LFLVKKAFSHQLSAISQIPGSDLVTTPSTSQLPARIRIFS
jgi:hypothetical protein